MVAAMSFGPRFNRLRHRAASHINAVESGPPETASTRACSPFRPANRYEASEDEIGVSSRGSFAPPLRGMFLEREVA